MVIFALNGNSAGGPEGFSGLFSKNVGILLQKILLICQSFLLWEGTP